MKNCNSLNERFSREVFAQQNVRKSGGFCVFGMMKKLLPALACVFLYEGAWAQAKVTVGSEISASDSLVLEVRGVDDASVSATPVERTSPNGKQLYCAYDIDITKDGREWQPEPEQPAMVTMEDPNFADGQLLDIYHEGANGLEFVATVASENGKITFPAHSFSVYIVAQAGDYARLKVIFHKADNSTVTIYVKPADISQGNFDQIVYNPGYGTLAAGISCWGWTTNSAYTVDTDTASNKIITIDSVRNLIRARLGFPVTDGQEMHFYTKLYKGYTISYVAEQAVIYTDFIPMRANESPESPYTVDAAYTPRSSTQKFVGWAVRDGYEENITGSGSPYENGTDVTIKGDVVFDVVAPEGHWLVFHENGKGATYVAAAFVKSTDVTVDPEADPEAPLTMTRKGYTFAGWWTGAPDANGVPTGSRFGFGSPLTENTHIYAKWNALSTADYSVIIWKQNVEGDGYDFESIITLNGSVNTYINRVTQTGTGNSAYASVDGTAYRWDGFHLGSYDQNVLINTEGNSVLNVYYNRNQHTLHFQAEVTEYTYTSTTSTSSYYTYYGVVNGEYVELTQSGHNFYYNGTRYKGTRYRRSSSTAWRDIKTITALYQQSIGGNFPIVGSNGVTYDNGDRWDPQSTATSDDVIVYFDIMPDFDEIFRWNDPASRPIKTINWWVESLDGTGVDATKDHLYDYDNNRIPAPPLKYVLHKSMDARYYSVGKEDFLDFLGFDRIGADTMRVDAGSGVMLYILDRYNPGTINFYYSRKVYPISFMDGSYYTGRDVRIDDEINLGQIREVSGIQYGADVSDQSYIPERPANATKGYVFEGWFMDKLCTQPYTFTTMKEGGITVYAKWRQVEYRVFLHPNASANGIPYTGLDWGNDDQTLNFRIAYGGTISAPTGTTDEYDFVGWFVDPGCERPFSESTVLNETTVTTTYNKATDFTDPVIDLYGTLGDGAYCNDADRDWITKKYDLYGKWRAKLPGAKGITVIFDDCISTPPVTSNAQHELYQDDVEAVANDPCTPPAGKEFSHWVLQRWNTSTRRFDPIPGSRILPGTPFTVLKSDAHRQITQWAIPNNPSAIVPSVDPESGTPPDGTHTEIWQATYTVMLRAAYVDVESPQKTYIVWYKNDGTNATVRVDGNASTPHTLPINETVDVLDNTSPIIPAAPSRTGYIFKGWYKYNVTSGTPPTSVSECTPDFLHYNTADSKYYSEAAYTNEVTKVAADLYSQTDYLYAVWEPEVEFTYATDVCEGTPLTLRYTTDGGVTLQGTWSAPAGSGTIDASTYTATTVESTTLTFTHSTESYPSKCISTPTNNFDVTFQTPGASLATYDYIWKGGAASPTDWNTPTNWYVYESGYKVATQAPSTAKDVYIGSGNCISNSTSQLSNTAEAKNITIASGASLTVPAGQTLNIAGNLINTGTLSADNVSGANKSKVVFCGTADQSISNAQTFRDVEFAQNTGRGIYFINAANGITVKGEAIFSKGIVNVGESTAIFSANATASVTDSASFVNGKVVKYTSDTENFTFPTGCATPGQPKVLGSVNIPQLSTSGVSITFHQKSAGQAGFGWNEDPDYYPRWWNVADNCSNNAERLNHVSNFEYWKVETTSPLSNLTLKVSAANAKSHFHDDASVTAANGNNGDKIRAAGYYGCWKNLGGSPSLGNSGGKEITVVVPTLSLDRSNEFTGILTLGSVDHNTVLPIELTSLTATCNGMAALVEWTTATEKNNDYFILEHSDDAINFTEVARIAGAGNSIEPIDYSYTDYGVRGGDNYYRLVQVDYDGSRTASEIVLANCVEASGEPEVVAYPNPFNGDLMVELENFGNQPARIDVYDVLGRIVYSEDVDAPQNSYQTVLHLGGLPDATYTVRVGTANFVINRKVVKNN